MNRRFLCLVLVVACLVSFNLQANETPKTGSREREMLRTLESAVNIQQRIDALTTLYLFYKDEKIHYKSLTYLQQLIQLQKSSNNPAGLETSYFHSGQILEEKQDYLTALERYFTALSYSRQIPEDRSGYIYLRIAEVFRVLNRRQLSGKYLKKALDYTIHYGDEDLKVFVYRSYSNLYYEEGDWTNALKFIDLSIRAETHRKKYLCAIRCTHQKASILLKIGQQESASALLEGNPRLQQAMELFKQAVDRGLKEKRYQELLPIMGDYIDKLIRLHRLSEAAGYLDHIDDIYAPYYPYFFVYYYLEAMLYEQQGQWDSALRLYRKTALELANRFHMISMHRYSQFEQVTGTIYSRMAEFYLRMFYRTGASLYLKKAIYFSEIKNAYIYEPENMKGKSFSFFLREKKKLESEYRKWDSRYHKWLKTKQDDKNLLLDDQTHRYQKKLEALKQQQEEISELILEAPLAYKNYRFEELDLEAIGRRLRPNCYIIKYTVLDHNIYAFCIHRNGFEPIKLKGSKTSILEKVIHLTEPLDDFTHGEVDYLRVNYNLLLARQLYDILLRDLMEQIEKTYGSPCELFIIPDKELFKLPFEALVTGFNNHPWDAGIVFSEYATADYLISKVPVSYALSLFHFLNDYPLKSSSPITITAFGDPVVDDSRQTGFVSPTGIDDSRENPFFAPLPSSRQELNAIAMTFGTGQSRIFLGERFTGKQFEANAPRAEIVHISTHFINNLRHPQYSALLFSKYRDSTPFYYAHNILRLKLNASLVVLSACESSETHLLGMQGLRGMTAAFKYAGARSMMVSMWPVDQYSSQLTPLFYSHYLEETKKARKDRISSAMALQHAKLEFMQKTASPSNGLTISFAHPFLWANYILYTFTPPSQTGK